MENEGGSGIPVVVELGGAHGRVRHRERLRLDESLPRFTLGRGVGADVVIDDPHVAALHARVSLDPSGDVRVEDLQSRNGVIVDGTRITGEQRIADGCFILGRTTVRVRTRREMLAPERPVVAMDRQLSRLATAGGALYALFFGYVAWLGAPSDLTTAVATSLIFAFLGAAGWTGAWSILSRLIVGEWRWVRHAAILFGLFAAMIILDLLWDLGWFALTLPHWPLLEAAILVLFGGLALYLHLSAASHVSRRAALLVATLIPMLAGGSAYYLVARAQSRDVNHIAAGTQVFPPEIRLRRGGSLEDYFNDASALRSEADARRPVGASDDGEDN